MKTAAVAVSGYLASEPTKDPTAMYSTQAAAPALGQGAVTKLRMKGRGRARFLQ